MIASERPRAIIAVDLDYFYAQCEEVRNPSIKSKPVVVCVYSGRTQESGAVSTCNYIARDLGVRSGMPIALAKRILRDNLTAVFLPMDMEYYQTVSERIMGLISSKGEKFEQASIDEAYLDVTTKQDANFRIAEEIGKAIKAEILSEEKMTCTVGVGQNKLMAKMAVDSKKPDGFTIILPGLERSFLNRLPVGKLFGIGPKTEEKLKAMGIVTARDLASADRETLSDHFGKKLGPTLRDIANGVDESPVVEKPIEQLSRIITLKSDANSFDFHDVLTPMSEYLSKKLFSSKMMCKTVGIILITSELKIKTRSKSFSPTTQSGDQILKVASELFYSFFEEQSKSPQGPISVRRVGIKVSDLVATSTSKKTETLEDYI